MNTDEKGKEVCGPEGEISHPRLWRLAMLVDGEEGRLDIVARSMVDDGGFVCISADAGRAGSEAEMCKRIEEAVYSRPFLLGDFGKVDIVVHSRAFMPVAEGLDAEALDAAAAIAHIDGKTDADGATDAELLHDSLTPCSLVQLWSMSGELYNFLRRTFPTATFHHHLSPLLRYFGLTAAKDGNFAKCHVYLHSPTGDGGSGGKADVAAFDADKRLCLANSYSYTNVADALFYLLSCARACGLRPGDAKDTGRMLLWGDRSLRAALMPELGKFLAGTVPAIFPSALLSGGDKALNAPLPLTILPLCE